MVISRKLLYMAFGGVLALSLVFGAYATFAQTDDSGDDNAPAAGSEDTQPAFPGNGNGGKRGPRGFDGERPDRSDQKEAFAEALGVTVEELEAAHESVRVAAIEQAVADGVLTQEQADEILSNENGPRVGKHVLTGVDGNALLAEELGITVEELEAARDEVNAARLADMVESGVLTEEQAEMLEAQRAVRDYLDTDAIQEAVQAAHEAAIEAALADGAITQEQADQMIENLENGLGQGGRGFGGGGHHGGPRGGQGGYGQGQGNFDQNSFFGNQAPVEGQDA